MPDHLDGLRAACARVDERIRTEPAYSHTSHLLVEVGGQVVVDTHYRGPEVADVFSVTKSVLATLVGVAVQEGLVPDLDAPVGDLLGLPLPGQTLRHLLTMTRGCATDGPFDVDAVMALPGGWLERIAAAPAFTAPGTAFRYDNGGAHLLAAALERLVGAPLVEYADRALFAPLGITDREWPRDPDGHHLGFGHLRLSAAALAALGGLWLQQGRRQGRQLLDPDYAAAMLTAHSPGGPPEQRPYGFLIWIDPAGPLAGGWAGQHVHAVPAADAVVVTTGDPGFDPGPPPTDRLAPGWRPAHDLVVEHVLPVLTGQCGLAI